MCDHSVCAPNHNLAKHRKVRVLGPDVDTTTKTPKTPRQHHNFAKHRKVRVLGPDVDTTKSTNTKTPPHHQNRLQFIGRMLQTTEKYENYYERSTSVLGPDVAEHRKVRELARKIDFSSWAECCSAKNVKKHEFYCKNTVQEHWRTPKSTRITTKNEHRRS